MIQNRKSTVAGVCLVLMGATGLAACGAGEGASDGSYQITFIPGIRGDKYYVALQCGAEAEARELGVDLETQGGTAFDPSSQAPVVQAVSATSPDAIVVAPVDSTAMYTPLKLAKEAGAEIVLVDTTLDNTDIAVSSIRSDYEEGGAMAADILSDLMGDRGQALLISIKPGLSTLDQGKAGFEGAISDHPDIEYLGAEYGNNDQVKVASIVSATLQSHPDLNGIFLPSGTDTEGVVAALERAGKVGDVKVVAFDAYPAQVEQVENGQVQALIVQKPFEMGQIGVRNAVAALEGETPEEEVETGLVVATQDNLDSPEVKPFLYESC